ncbi:hypothetical protein ACU4I5_18540 [Ensifer adhaerens]
MTEESQERAIGRIEGKLDMILADQEKARIDRKHQYDKSEAIERRLDVTDQKLSAVTAGWSDAAPVISDIRRWKERFIGMQMFVVFLAGSAGAALVTLWKWISVKIGLY